MGYFFPLRTHPFSQKGHYLMSTLIYLSVFTLFVMNLIAGVFIWFHVATVSYNRYRFGTDTAPKQVSATTSADEVAAIMAAWRAARQSEEEVVPRLKA